MSSNESNADNNPILADDDLDLVKPDSGLYDSEFWAISRHELIAEVAEERLKPMTAQRIKVVVQPLVDQGFLGSLSSLAGWADLIKKRGARDDDDEDTKEFLNDNQNKSRGKWHYVNLPLDAVEYDPDKYPKPLTSREDVVQILQECIRVLQGTSERFRPINALRLLVHLVGDVHQPIHVGCCYIDENGAVAKLVRNPGTVLAKNLENDQGGNKLILPIGQNGVNLHSYWDGRLGGSNPDLSEDEGEGDAVVTPELKSRFVNKLSNMVAEASELAVGEGEGEADATSLQDWPVEWANDSLVAARSAYKSLKIIGPNANDDRNFDVEWEGKAAYDERCKPIVLERMKSSVKNLAKLLDAIYA